jgi:predicted TIM-barrel fold metal-dependent hydrolase
LIDVHTHPVLVQEIMEKDKDMLRVVKEVFDLQNRPQPLETFILQMEVSGVDRSVLLPIDCTTSRGCKVYSNEQIAELVSLAEGKFMGFASVDPHSGSAPDDLEGAIRDLGLVGLKLAPGIQEFRPDDEKVFPIYEKASDLNIPLMIHSGLSWEPGSRLAPCHPGLLEKAAAEFPKLRICIAHFGWPWVAETAALLLKYPNLYADTSCLYADTPKEFIQFTFSKQVPTTWIERSLRNQVMFGSNYPRIETFKMVEAVQDLGFSEGASSRIFEENARRFIGI